MGIAPPPKFNPSFIQPTQVLRAPINRNKPHQSTREIERRRKQLERAKGKT